MAFKLIITLTNFDAGKVRKLISNNRYITQEEAETAAKKMEYTYRNGAGRITHTCAVDIQECNDNDRQGGLKNENRKQQTFLYGQDKEEG